MKYIRLRSPEPKKRLRNNVCLYGCFFVVIFMAVVLCGSQDEAKTAGLIFLKFSEN